MKKFLTFLCVGILAATGCSRVDDLEDRVDEIDSRVTTLEELVAQLNTQVKSIESLVNTIKDGGYIQNIQTETKDGINYYTLTLSNNETYTIHDGKDGADGIDGADGTDGHTPAVGVKLDESDNNYYWTVDGQYTDPKVKVNGNDGKTPQISIISGYWCIKWPGDEYWSTLSEAKGKDGDSFFKEVKIGDEDVTFTLTNGESFTVSLLGGFRLVCQSTAVGVSANSTAKVNYTVKGAKEGEEVVVYVKYVSEGWSASVDETAAQVSINVPSDPDGGLVIVEAINNATSKVADQAIRFEKGVLSIATLSYEVSDASGILEVSLSTNMTYEVTSDAEWIKQVETKAAHTEKLQFAYDLNTEADARTANITIKGATGDVVTVVVLQKGCPPLKSSYEVGEYYERQGVVGIVWHADENYVKVLALDEKSYVQWAEYSSANSWADSQTDGLANMNTILNNQYSSITYFPAQKWCNDKGKGWYMPAIDEMCEILNNIGTLNTSLENNKGTKLTKGYYYWSSTQNTDTKAVQTACWDWDYEKAVKAEKASTLTCNARASFNVSLKASSTDPETPSAYKIGDEMKLDNGDGVVAYIDETGEHGYVISKLESDEVKWATTGQYASYWPTSTTDGKANCERLSTYLEIISSCPAANWAVYTCGNAGWFLPAQEQLKSVLANFTAINEGLAKIGGTPLTEGRKYWSSTTWFSDDSGANARYYSYSNGAVSSDSSDEITYYKHFARAIHAF
jgi:outer membrane murein-binding lipoprotein Lpp